MNSGVIEVFAQKGKASPSNLSVVGDGVQHEHIAIVMVLISPGTCESQPQVEPDAK